MCILSMPFYVLIHYIMVSFYLHNACFYKFFPVKPFTWKQLIHWRWAQLCVPVNVFAFSGAYVN